MSILDRFSRGRYALPKNATFRLTQEGKEKLLSYSGTPEARVLSALETCGTSDRDEIASASGLSRGNVEKIMLVLIQKGYVQRSGSASRGETLGLGDDI